MQFLLNELSVTVSMARKEDVEKIDLKAESAMRSQGAASMVCAAGVRNSCGSCKEMCAQGKRITHFARQATD